MNIQMVGETGTGRASVGRGAASRLGLVSLCFKVLGRILKVGVQIVKQGVQGSNVHDLFSPAGPRRSPFFPRKTPTAVQFHAVDVVMLTMHLNASLLEY